MGMHPIPISLTLSAFLLIGSGALIRKARQRKRAHHEAAKVAEAWREKVNQRMSEQDAKRQQKHADGKRAFKPNEGMVWNELRSYPRNAACVCGSGKKFKICCLHTIPDAIPLIHAPRTRKIVQMAKAGYDVPAILAKERERGARL
jgi:hypothetical protein